jgi:hypothetical protein
MMSMITIKSFRLYFNKTRQHRTHILDINNNGNVNNNTNNVHHRVINVLAVSISLSAIIEMN